MSQNDYVEAARKILKTLEPFNEVDAQNIMSFVTLARKKGTKGDEKEPAGD